MNAQFTDINATADYIGPGAIEVPIYQTEILDLVRRRGVVRSAHQAGTRDRTPFALL